MVTEALIRSLRPPDRFPPRLGSLTPAQESVVREFLVSIGAGDLDETVRAEAIQAFDEWWRPAARARPTAEQILALRSVPVVYRDVRHPAYGLVVPETLVSTGLIDIPTESRRVELWRGYACGDVHMVVAVNTVAHSVRSFADAARLYAGFFGIPVAPQPVTVPKARRAVRLNANTGDADAGGERVTMVVAEGSDVVALTIRAADREDIRLVIDRIASSFTL
jgi:hypothetical protein